MTGQEEQPFLPEMRISREYVVGKVQPQLPVPAIAFMIWIAYQRCALDRSLLMHSCAENCLFFESTLADLE